MAVCMALQFKGLGFVPEIWTSSLPEKTAIDCRLDWNIMGGWIIRSIA